MTFPACDVGACVMSLNESVGSTCEASGSGITYPMDVQEALSTHAQKSNSSRQSIVLHHTMAKFIRSRCNADTRTSEQQCPCLPSPFTVGKRVALVGDAS